MGWIEYFFDGNTGLAKDFVRYMFTGDNMVDFYLSYPYAMFPAKKISSRTPNIRKIFLTI